MRGRRLVLLVAILLVLVVAGAVSGIRLFSDPACPSGGTEPVPVLIARRFIPGGTSGSVIVSRGMLAGAEIPCADRKAGALADPADLVGRTTVVDLFPGQQLTAADLSSP